MKKETSPCCGKEEISREIPPLDAGLMDVGGWQEKCAVCGSLLWVPLDETKPIELAVIPVYGLPMFEPETIFLDEKLFLEAMAKGEK